MIVDLPHQAIKVFVADNATSKIQLPSQSAAPEEAFFHIGSISFEKITIFAEDKFACEILKKALQPKGEGFMSQFEFKSLPGGASSIWTHYVPSFVVEKRKDILILFDADQSDKLQLPDPKNYGPSQHLELRSEIEKIIGGKVKFLVDGGDDGENSQQLEELLRSYCSWVEKNVRTLPGSGTPEECIWNMMEKDNNSEACDDEDAKNRFVQLTKKELGRTPSKEVSSNDIYHTQIRKLHAIGDDHDYFEEIREIVEKFLSQRKKLCSERSC